MGRLIHININYPIDYNIVTKVIYINSVLFFKWL